MSSKNNNKINVPEARAAMDKFKMEAAAEVGVNLKKALRIISFSTSSEDKVSSSTSSASWIVGCMA